MKKHHPDVAGSSSPDGQVFRNIQEAYGVLSVNESRASYDLSVKKDPNAYRNVSEAEFAKTNNFEQRDASGNTMQAAPRAGSYAEERMAELKMQREKYNVNHIGLYKGGLPKKGRGAIRGSALGAIGEFHQPSVHNLLENYHQDSKMVTSEDAVKFKHFMNNDKIDHNRSKPLYPMYYDRNHEYMKERSFWLGVIALGAGTSYLIAKWTIESDRQKMWIRMGSIHNLDGN